MNIGGDDPNMLLTAGQMSTAKRALLGVKMGREDLEAGITTVRDLGNSGHNGDVALRDAINEGWAIGPRMLVSTRALAAAGRTVGLNPIAQQLREEEYAVVGAR
jgi:imidazolonepropionase-like amidohydrolase